MSDWTSFTRAQLDRGAKAVPGADPLLIATFGELGAEYDAIANGCAIVDRSYRGSLQITGTDRVAWLHNLTTNQIRTLGVGEGAYAFALNVQGRILFDLNALIRSDSIWVDLDRCMIPQAVQHFDKYRVIEDVGIGDQSDETVRVALVGPELSSLLVDLGFDGLDNLAEFGQAELTWGGIAIPLVRHDFCGPPSVELYVPASSAVEFWQELTSQSRNPRAVPAGIAAVQTHRIEAGFPWPGREITDAYLPAETGQLDRAVSFSKGCYLGQEIVARMRSRDVAARRLVGLHIEGDALPPEQAAILDANEKVVGVLTSVCRSPAMDAIIGMGYVKTGSSEAGSVVTVSWPGMTIEASIKPLGFAAGKCVEGR